MSITSKCGDAVIDEDMALTQEKIESDPVLSSLLPGWKATPRAEARAPN
ncbi:hypothetical protein [Streptomyces sp. NPDC056061]